METFDQQIQSEMSLIWNCLDLIQNVTVLSQILDMSHIPNSGNFRNLRRKKLKDNFFKIPKVESFAGFTSLLLMIKINFLWKKICGTWKLHKNLF